MRTVSGALRPTNINWLPVLSNIEPPQIRRDRATLLEYKKAQQLMDRVPISALASDPCSPSVRRVVVQEDGCINHGRRVNKLYKDG